MLASAQLRSYLDALGQSEPDRTRCKAFHQSKQSNAMHHMLQPEEEQERALAACDAAFL